LERSGGLTLRYLLPFFALLPAMALIGCFPIGGTWHARVVPRVVVGALLAIGVVWLWWEALAHPDPARPAEFAPGISIVWAIVAGGVITIAGTRSGRRLATLVLMVIAAAWWAPMIARTDKAIRSTAWFNLEAEQAAFLAGVPPTDPWRAIYVALRASEHADASSCAHPRYFALTRFDEPLALQSPDFGGQVFYAGRDVEAARKAGPLVACDYIITTPALMQTDKGQALAAALSGGAPLTDVAQTPDLVALKPAPIR
jgi:hypothetical protein